MELFFLIDKKKNKNGRIKMNLLSEILVTRFRFVKKSKNL